MLKLAADENFNNRILRTLQRDAPHVDVVRIQDTEVYEKDDRTVLEWAAKENRILLTHDVQTMPDFAYERVKAGLAMPGVFEVNDNASFANIVEDIILLVEDSKESEWEGQVIYLPFPKRSKA